MIITVGIYIIYKRKLLICHPTGNVWNRNWSIPKGKMEDDETYEQTAVRETLEESNILIDETQLSYIGNQIYRSNRKQLIAYMHVIPDETILPELKCTSIIDGKWNNGLPEMDEFMWVDYNTAYSLLHESQQKLVYKLKQLMI